MKHPNYTTEEVILQLESAVSNSGSQRSVAKKLGISPQYLNDILSRRKEPGKKLLDALQLKRIISYEMMRK